MHERNFNGLRGQERRPINGGQTVCIFIKGGGNKINNLPPISFL